MAKGYDSVSLREIAEASNTHPTIPRYHFGTKQELWVETLRFLFVEVEKLMKDTQTFDPENENPLEFLKRQTKIRVSHSARNPEFIRIIHTEIVYNSERLELIKDMLDKMEESTKSFFVQLQSIGIARHLNLDSLSFIGLNLISAPFMSYFQLQNDLTEEQLEKLIDNHTELLVSFLVGK